MAKGNLFLGMGRGKVGDVVFYRMNGWQMARVRNRNPKNPRTNEQLYQRAVIATTMKAYSMGKEIFDHAFQGYTVGEGCMRRFNSVNARILRSQLISDIQNATPIDNQLGRFCAPRSITGVPIIGLQVSEGTLTQDFIQLVNTNGVYKIQFPNKPSTESEDVTTGQFFETYGVSPGDIFTFVFMLSDLDEIEYKNLWYDNVLASQYVTRFGWIRLTVKGDDWEGEHGVGININDVFEVESGGDINFKIGIDGTFRFGQDMNIIPGMVNYAGVVAVIRSREDYKLRSTSYTVPFHSKDFGIASQFILDTWINDVEKIGESELILEGGEANGMRTTVTENAAGSPPMGLSDDSPIIDSPVQESDTRRKGRTRA